MPVDSILSLICDSIASAQSKNPRCDNYYLGPKDHLSRCARRARYQLTILDSGDIDVLLRCQACWNELYAEIESGVTFEILDEVQVGVLAVSELWR
ncbi:MAG: hypothetical protein DPW09_44530 [Anaerolineae bacterium]|nr:hypothetical protein [Anaerolineae bacterium]